MTSRRSKLQEDTHFRVLRLLQDNPEMSQRVNGGAKAGHVAAQNPANGWVPSAMARALTI